MKILELFGSPRRDGATAALLASFNNALPKDAERLVFSAYDESVMPCTACGHCDSGQGCIYDDMDGLDSALTECDIVVIASPVYFLSFPAPMKAVIDRFQRYWAEYKKGVNRFGKWKRPVVLLLAAGSPSESGEVIKRQLRWVFPAIGCELFSDITAHDTDRTEISPEVLELAADTARRLTDSFSADNLNGKKDHMSI